MAQVKKLGDGKYLVRASFGTGSDRVFANETFYGTLAEARALGRQMDDQIKARSVSASKIKFGAFFELWIKAITPTLSPRTVDGYDGNIRRYALEPLKNLKLRSVENSHIQTIYNDLQHLSPTSIANLHSSLRKCFNWGIARKYLTVNPCIETDRPKKLKPEITFLDDFEVRVFAEVCQRMKLGVVFEFALETGMRPEEYLALRWADIRGNDVSVMRAMQHNRKGGGYYFADLKTKMSRRRIPISDGLRQRLVTHKREQNEHRLAMKGTWFNHDLVFPNTIGQPFELSNLNRRYFKPVLEQCKFPKSITLYSLRHTCATMLLLAGVNPKIVSERLGHASVTLTLDTYSHVLPNMQDEATATMSRILKFRA